jgi:hypothetical protein
MRYLFLFLIIIATSCNNKLPDGVPNGKYRIVEYRGSNPDPNTDFSVDFEQYFIFKGNEFRNYLVEDGVKVFYDDNGNKVSYDNTLAIINYGTNNTFSYTDNGTKYIFYYSLIQDTLHLEIDENVITLIKQ